MTETSFQNGDRVSHETKGLGTVRFEAAADTGQAAPPTPDSIPVVWDDDRFPVGLVPCSELEMVPDAAAGISTGV